MRRRERLGLFPLRFVTAYRTSARRGGFVHLALTKNPARRGLFGGTFFTLHRYVREAPFFRISKETEYGYIRIERLQQGCLLL